MFKKSIFLIITVLAICITPCFVYAGESIKSINSNIATVQWVSTNSATCTLSISNGEAQNYVILKTNDISIDSANFIIDLQQYKSGKWVSIKKWTSKEVVKSLSAEFNQSYSVEKGYKYRLKGNVKIYKGSTLVDTLSVTSTTKSY